MSKIESFFPNTMRVAILLCTFSLTWPQSANAHPNNYPFDYDPSLSEDPVGIPGDLEDLHNALPGLPEGLVEIEMDGIAFNYFPETLDMIRRATVVPRSQHRFSAFRYAVPLTTHSTCQL